MKFRPCIDLRQGKVVQIVGSTLKDTDQDNIVTNFESTFHIVSYNNRCDIQLFLKF